MRLRARERGFTLTEAIVVIAITGIIAGMVAVFIRKPVEGYIDTTRRADMTDAADTALRRLARDLRLALPNSIRVASAGPVQYLEYLETRTGGRYRADPDGATGGGDVLDFAAADTAFDTLGLLPTAAGEQPVPGDRVVIYNLGIPGADAYAGDNTSVISAVGAGALPNESRIGFAAKTFPLASPGQRFHVIRGPVSYVCDPVARTLTRNSGYPIAAAQPTSFAGGTAARLADHVSACGFAYIAGPTQRNSLVSVNIALTRENETVRMHHEVHVPNLP